MDHLNQLLTQERVLTPFVWLDSAILFFIIVALSVGIDKINRHIFVKTLRRIVEKTHPKALILIDKYNVINKISDIVPLLVIAALTPLAFKTYPNISIAITTLCYLAVLVKLASFSFALLDVCLALTPPDGIGKNLPLQSLNQLIKLFIFIVVAIIAISTVLGKSPIYFLSGLGAMTAVLLLIFKDTILGFVAGVQLATNNMVNRGDWIEMPKYGADGEILEVGLTTVQIQNWDKTITMLPTYALVSDSFKNWRGMSQHGARRIKRAVRLDVLSIVFMDQQLLDKLLKNDVISHYLHNEYTEISQQNQPPHGGLTSHTNENKLTNIGVFCAYLESYLKNHPMIHQEMTLMVRQLPADEHGLPLEIYCFCTEIRWTAYEKIQAQLFEHIYAILPKFQLNAFQNPTDMCWKSPASSRDSPR